MDNIRADIQSLDDADGQRRIPIGHTQIAGTGTGSADTIFTVPSSANVEGGVVFELKRLTVVNTTGTGRTITVYAVPSGDTIADDVMEISEMSVAANTAVRLDELMGGMYEAGTTIEVFADAGSALTIHGWGMAYA